MGKIDNAEDAITRAITMLQNPQPFFAHILMYMRPELLPKEAPMQSMGVDARGRLFFNREFVMSLSEQELQGSLCHEVMHVALLHMLRRGTRESQLANIAQDVAVNMIVRQSGMQLPKGTIPVDIGNDSSSFQLGPVKVKLEQVSEKSWEQLYSEILDQIKDQRSKLPKELRTSKNGFDMHMDGKGKENEDISEQEVRELEQKWQQALADAATYARQKGNLPAGMSRIMDELFKPKVAWKQMLMKYLRPHLMPVDWTYQRPHRKSQVLDVFLPNVIKEQCEVEVVVDTSGSIGKKDLDEFLSEIVGIAKSMRYIKMWVTFVDAAVQNRYEVENGNIAKIMAMEPKGGGGTSMEVGLDYIKEHNAQIPVAIVLTDGYDSWGRKRSDYPFDVIWVITENGLSAGDMRSSIPYGHKVKMGE